MRIESIVTFLVVLLFGIIFFSPLAEKINGIIEHATVALKMVG